MYANKEWVEITGAPDNLDRTANTFDAQGSVIVVGNTLVAPGNPDVLITKYDREGVLLWQQTFAGTAGTQDHGVAVTADRSGNCFVAAAVTNTTTSLDIAVLKYNASGTLVWSALWNGPTNLMDAPSCIALDASGNVYAAGSTLNTLTNPDYAIVKLNASGTIQWSATYNGSKIEGGWDFSSNVHISNNSNPLNSHGTGCAGIIGALRNNGTGVAGIAGGDVDGTGNTGVALISLGIFNDAGTAVAASVIAGAIVEGSTDFNGSYGYGCDVLNNSYGGGAYNITQINAVRTCWRNKCVFVASRGNDGVSSAQYPGGYGGDPWVLSVGASGTDGGYKNTTNGDTWWSSNYGSNVDVVAPGTTQIITTTENPSAPFGLCPPLSSGYECFNGTSAAAPHVAGVAALMMSEHHVNNGAPNNLACEDVESLIERFATDEGAAGYDDYNGHGRVNAGAAVQGVERPYYTVFHSSAPNSTQQTTFANQAVTNMTSGFTQQLFSTCNSRYFVGLDYSPQTNKLLTTRITRTPLNDHDLQIATDIVLMNPDGTGQEVVNIPFPE